MKNKATEKPEPGNTNAAQSTEDQINPVSRRKFILSSAATAAAVSAVSVTPSVAIAETSVEKLPDIDIPDEFAQSLNAPLTPGEFSNKAGMSGAQVFAKACKQENLAALFCCPGNYDVINAIAAEGIPSYGGRTEGNMCAAADAFSRATGEVAACSGTEGPGFTNMMMEMSTASAAKTPLLVLASNAAIAHEDSYNSIQFQLQQPMTEGIKKWGKRIISPDRVHEYAAYAFRNLKTGVPGPVHLDFPGEVAREAFSDPSQLRDYYSKAQYRSESVANPSKKEIDQVVKLIKQSERPMIVAGQGIFYHKAWDALKRVAERNDIPVVETGPSRGHFPDSHRLSAGTANNALGSVDLIIFVGQYVMPPLGVFAFGPDAKTIRVHPDASDLGRNWPLDLGIVSDENIFLETLAEALPRRKRDTWISELVAARNAFEKTNATFYQLSLKHSHSTGVLHPGVIAKELADFLYHGDIPKEQTVFTLGSYTGSMWMRRFLRTHRPGQLINGAYQYYPIGPDFGFTVGAGAAVQQGVGPQKPYKGAPVVTFTGDAGAGYSIMEMETLAKYKIPAIVIVYNNNAWGILDIVSDMVGRAAPRAKHMYLFQENIRYDKIAQAVGARGEYVTTPEAFTQSLKTAYRLAEREGVSTLINCQSLKEFSQAQTYPPGRPHAVHPGVAAFSH